MFSEDIKNLLHCMIKMTSRVSPNKVPDAAVVKAIAAPPTITALGSTPWNIHFKFCVQM